MSAYMYFNFIVYVFWVKLNNTSVAGKISIDELQILNKQHIKNEGNLHFPADKFFIIMFFL